MLKVQKGIINDILKHIKICKGAGIKLGATHFERKNANILDLVSHIQNWMYQIGMGISTLL